RWRLQRPPVFIGFLANTVLLARAGEPVRVVLARRRLSRLGTPLPLAVLAGSAVAEVVVGTLVWAALVVPASLILGLPSYAVLIGAAAGAAAGAALALSVLLRTTGVGSWPQALVRRRGGEAATRFLLALATGLGGLRRPRELRDLLALALLSWVLQWAAVWAIVVALHIDVGPDAALAVLVTTSVAQAFPLLPGNVGSFQAAVALPLVATHGVAPVDAVALGVALHLLQAASAVIPGAVFLAREDLGIARLRRLPPLVALGAEPGSATGRARPGAGADAPG
ncbi:MAG TPA: lysylphosphatidylglycerol synthase domain-containing protein, partial [Miltoncostaeaceae bacterium]|nr:lysylphosphatidylglycerol synthase domain-containing protein [Miltoncostaeaceae bacterium]